MPISAMPAAAAGFVSSVAPDVVPPLLVVQLSSSSLGSGGNKDGEGEVSRDRLVKSIL